MTARGKPLVAILMGSDTDLNTMAECARVLEVYEIPYEIKVLSAHRSPEHATRFAREAERRGFKVLIAGAGGSAHLAGVMAAHSTLPVIGVPVASSPLGGFDSLLSTVQMPAGIPVGTLAIGRAGAINAALLAVAILANQRPELREKLRQFRAEQTQKVLNETLG